MKFVMTTSHGDCYFLRDPLFTWNRLNLGPHKNLSSWLNWHFYQSTTQTHAPKMFNTQPCHYLILNLNICRQTWWQAFVSQHNFQISESDIILPFTTHFIEFTINLTGNNWINLLLISAFTYRNMGENCNQLPMCIICNIRRIIHIPYISFILMLKPC